MFTLIKMLGSVSIILTFMSHVYAQAAKCDAAKLCAQCPAGLFCSVAGSPDKVPPGCVQNCLASIRPPIAGQEFDILAKGISTDALVKAMDDFKNLNEPK